MTTDADILAIQRQRRQQRRCVRCGKPSSRSTLCAGCMASYQYCPMCEAIYERPPSRKAHGSRASEYCAACDRKHYAATSTKRSPAEYHATRREKAFVHLPAVVRLYRQGCTYVAMGAALGLHPDAVNAIVRRARAAGCWPEGLRRGRGWRGGRGA